MDEDSRRFYEVVFRSLYLERTEGEFQDLFSELMELKHPGDFIRTRPWGRIGDRKNDGYLKSARILFQVYAPNEMKVSVAVNKIHEDFKGALAHWKNDFDTWVFVHNSRSGLSPTILKKLLDLEKENQPIKIIAWGYHELRQIVFSLSGSDIALLLGPPLSRQDILGVQFLDLKVVVLNIAGQQPVSEPEIRPVSADKLATNALSVEVEMMLKLGMLRADRVREFFANWPDPLLGDRVASAFKQEYSRLSDSGITPDDIFAELLAFAGGTRRTSLKHEAAVLAVLAYLFEQCDIFEESYRDGL